MTKILNFPSPKKNNPFVVKVMVVTLILLAALKLPELMDNRSALLKKHAVFPISNQTKITEDYLVYDLNGNSLKLSEMLGENLTILAFWATWCGYCAEEMPVMDETIPYLQKHGINIIPVARGDDTPEKIKQFFKRGNIKNVESVIASSRLLHKDLGVASYPTFIAIDKDGIAFANLRPNWEASDIYSLFEQMQEMKREL